MTTVGTSITWFAYLNEICEDLEKKKLELTQGKGTSQIDELSLSQAPISSRTGKQELTEALGVSRTTLNRWRQGTDYPRARNIKQLLEVLPESQSKQLLALMKKDPKMVSRLPAELQEGPEWVEEWETLPHVRLLNQFGLRMLRLKRETPDPFWQLSGAILREALTVLETHPQHTGLYIMVATCMPQKQDHVRSLRFLIGMGTGQYPGHLHSNEKLFGIESLAGEAILQRHGVVIADLNDQNAPSHPVEQARSAVAFPIRQQGNTVAGSFLVSSTQPNYFTQEHIELIEIFADLICLALSEHQFVPIGNINLGLMPSFSEQQERFRTFRQRVEAEYKKGLQDESVSMRDLTNIQELVRSQIEDELLALADTNTPIAY